MPPQQAHRRTTSPSFSNGCSALKVAASRGERSAGAEATGRSAIGCGERIGVRLPGTLECRDKAREASAAVLAASSARRSARLLSASELWPRTHSNLTLRRAISTSDPSTNRRWHCASSQIDRLDQILAVAAQHHPDARGKPPQRLIAAVSSMRLLVVCGSPPQYCVLRSVGIHDYDAPSARPWISPGTSRQRKPGFPV